MNGKNKGCDIMQIDFIIMLNDGIGFYGLINDLKVTDDHIDINGLNVKKTDIKSFDIKYINDSDVIDKRLLQSNKD